MLRESLRQQTYFSLVFHLLHDFRGSLTARCTAAKTHCCEQPERSSPPNKAAVYNLMRMEKD